MSSNDDNEQASHISNLQQSFTKQQKKISALKELVRKSEAAHGKSTSSAQEKVKNIAQRLTHLKIKARSRQALPATSPVTFQENAATFVPTATIEPLLEQQQQNQPPPAPLSHSLSYGDQSLNRSQSGLISAPPLAPVVKHRSDSSKSLSNVVIPGSEKVQLLRQQMEHNKLLIAQRASSKQHLEQLVSQLKEKFDTTQQCLEDTSELGKSMSDLSALMMCSPASRERHKSATDLSSQPFCLEKERIKFLENRCRILEKQLDKERQAHSNQELASVNESTSMKRVEELENKVVELENALRERQSEIQIKIGETKGLLEELEHMRVDINAKDEEVCLLQLRCGDTANELNEINNLEVNESLERLRNESVMQQKRIHELEEVNDMLETARCDLTMKNNKYEDQLQQMKVELDETIDKLRSVQEALERSETQCGLLEETVKKLQKSKEAAIVESEVENITSVQVNGELTKQIQELRDACDKLSAENINLQRAVSDQERLEVSDASIAEKIAALEATIESQRKDLNSRQSTVSRLEEEVMEKTIELNVLNANFKVLEEKLEASGKSKSLFSSSGGDGTDNPALEVEIQQLRQKLDENNKAMIKLKLKCKHTEKQVEKLKKSSDLHAENARLNILIEDQQQKIAELEDEKGQWQLTQVESKAESSADEKREITELRSKYETEKGTIRLLEEQKYEQAQRLEATEEKLHELQLQLLSLEGEQTARVKSEISEIRLEEKMQEQSLKMQQLEERLSRTLAEVEDWKRKLFELQDQKQMVDKKLENYMVENMELLDKVEKLSKSSSSAESIEIVERLTQQERAEIDEYNKRLEGNVINSVNELTQTELAPDLSDSLIKLREESSELMNKIELFTAERCEVLERMEHLTAENHELIQKVEQLTSEKEEMETNMLLASDAKIKLEERVKELSKEKDQLSVQVAEFKMQGSQLSQELSSLQKSSEVVAALDSKHDAALFEKCEKCLSNLNHELETYRKAGDKTAKFNASKKLAKEAKNAYTQLSELLQKVKEASTAVETVTVVETVVAVTAPNGKALAEYEQLTTQNRVLKATIEDLRRELLESREDNAAEAASAQVPAIIEDETAIEQHEKQIANLKKYEEEFIDLQSMVEDLRLQLVKARTVGEERNGQITELKEELDALRKTSHELEILLNDNNLSHEKEVEELARLRTQLEGKCEIYEGEMNILQTLVIEQKQQLIEASKEHEHENNMKLIELQERDEQIIQLREEISELKHALEVAGSQLSEDLHKECEKLREALRINKNLVAEQVNELSNKQDTIETLNQQIIDLYKMIEENANKLTEREDEISYLQDVVESNGRDLEYLRKDNDEQKSVVDKLLNELHSHKATVGQLPQLESDVQRLESKNKQLDEANQKLEQRNREQLEKLKKYAANLKKRTTQCQVLEGKLKELEKGSLEAMQTKQQDASHERELHDSVRQLEKENEKLKMEIETKTKEVKEATEVGGHLKNQLEELEGRLMQKDAEIVQNQSSDMGDAVLPMANIKNNEKEELEARLADVTHKLDDAETEIHKMQEELLQVRESERGKLLAINEIREALNHKSELVAQLQQQMERNSRDQTDDVAHMLEKKVTTLEECVQKANEELKAKSLKFEKSKAVIKERNNQIHRLQAQLKDLQDKVSCHPEEEYIQPKLHAASLSSEIASVQPQIPKDVHDELKVAYDKLHERFNTEQANFQATIARLETLHDGIHAKLQENMSYIETLEQENANFKEKICKLEEGIATFEERRASMERRTNLLCAQMQSRETEYEKNEDELIYRLNMLSEHDEVIGERLLQSQEEKDDLLDRVERAQAEFNKLSTSYAKLEKEYQTYREQSELSLETETQSLREQLTAAHAEVERIRRVYDAKLTAKTTELDELEFELNEQITKMNSEKRAVTEDLERSRDECTEQKDEIVRLKESLNASEQAKQELEREATWLRMENEGSQQDQYEMQELRMQNMQDKTEIDNLRHQIETLASNHEIELQALRTQISELDTLRMQVGQNQTDDQVFIETENKRLTDLLAEKESVIENFQRQNLQLQMAATASVQQQTPVSTAQQEQLGLIFASQPQNHPSPATLTANQVASQSDDCTRLQIELLERNEQIGRLQRELNTVQSEYHNLLEGNNELQRQLMVKYQEIENLRNYNLPTASSATLFGQQQMQDVIPAPPFFFSSEQSAPSPFDEIVQVRTIDNLENTEHAHGGSGSDVLEQPTIEDLQRNVSDLEKHAQDLENKLATRNQREFEIEERLRENQHAFSELERQLRDRVQELNALRVELHKAQEQNMLLKQDGTVMQQNVEQLKASLLTAECELKDRDQQLSNAMQSHVQQKEVTNVSDAPHLVDIGQLEAKLMLLETLLQQRDKDVSQLQRELNDEKTLREHASTLESQIIPDSLVSTQLDAAQNTIPTLDMFFGGTSTGSIEFESMVIPPASAETVVEDVIVPEKAYVCHPQDSRKIPTTAKSTAFDLDGDWGDPWGAQEAAAEEEHFSKRVPSNLDAHVSLVSREQHLEIQLAEQVERIAELQLTVERCEQQKQELQVKSGKLMKKLKEYKTKVDDLQASATKTATAAYAASSLFDLDAAIEDELKAQIKHLEERLQEEYKQHEAHGIEKEKLLKRIDVLTAGSERMAEMKERQDMDVQMYQARIRELQQKLIGLEAWGTDTPAIAKIKETAESQQLKMPSADCTVNPQPASAFNSPSTWEPERQRLTQQIAELTAEMHNINVDRQELQALLEDEKANVVRIEESRRLLQQQLAERESSSTASQSTEETKYIELKGEHEQLQVKYNNLHAAYIEQTSELNCLKAHEEQLSASLQQAETSLENSEANASRNEEHLKTELLKMEGNLVEKKTALEKLESEHGALQSQMLQLQTENSELRQAKKELKTDNISANTELIVNENAVLREQNDVLEQRVKQLEQEVLNLPFSGSTAALSASTITADMDELNAQLQEKESEIMHLKQRIEDLMREDQTEKLVLEILTKNQEIHLLKMQVKHLEEDKQELEHNLSVQITNEIHTKNSNVESENVKLRERAQQLEQELEALQSEKRHMEEELKVLNNHVINSLENEDKLKAAVLQLDAKSIEIAELRLTIEGLRANGHNGAESVATIVAAGASPVDYVALNAQWEAIVEQKCSEIAKIWREHLEQREADFKVAEARLREEIAALRQAQPHEPTQTGISAETTATSTPASISTTQSGTSSGAASKDGTPLRHRIINEEREADADADAIIEKMQTALESQEMEIVTLKEQLAIRSAEYARLAAQYDPFKLQTTTSHSGLSGGVVADIRRNANTASSDVSLVPKSELDLAMYMLHQRDMRCEEMKLELVSLLEERDTLQLKLSNTLRQVEAIKAVTNYVEVPTTQTDNTLIASPVSTATSQLTRSVTSPAPGDSDDELNQKLSQLQTVNHSKDQVIRGERDQLVRQMENMQEDVAKMPSAAVLELVGTDAAQTAHSPSSVLLNWLWGNKPDAGNSSPH